MISPAPLPQPGTSAWNRLNPKVKQKAHHLRRALAGVIELHLAGQCSRDTLQAVGLRDYQSVTGYSITPRHFWRLFDQVIERDGGRNQFDNLAIYLPGRLARQKPALPFSEAARDLANLRAAVMGIPDVVNPNPAQVLLAWDSALNDYQALMDAGCTDLRARRAVLAGLDACGLPLAITPSALRRTFCRRVDKWIAGGRTPSAIKDGRTARQAGDLPLSEDDKKLLIARGLQGGLSMAWRDCMASGELSSAVVQHYIGNPSSKSYVPKRIREELAPQIEMLQNLHRGPRQARLNGAYTTRDWSDVSPADWYSADDTTLPLYYWEEDATGRPHLLRGQCLVMIDCRTLRILGLALHSERNYNAKVIRGLILSVHDTYGLPREGFYFERGIWAKAKLLKGASDDIPGEDTELGLREWVQFKHAQPGNARAKTVERVIGLMQTRMESQPGYCGRNEQVEKFERLQKQMLAANAGRRHPSEFALHRDEWMQRLHEICLRYNDEPQQGRLLVGLSPREAWDTHFDATRPLVKLEGAHRHLLANHRRPLKVTRNGICIQLGNGRHWFRNEVTAAFVGRIVQVYFNPEDLSSIFLREDSSDPVAHVIPAAPTIPAMTASPEEMQKASASVQAHSNPARTLYRAITPFFPQNAPSPFRQTIVAPEEAEQNADIAAQQAAIREEQQQTRRTQRQLNRLQRAQGIAAHPAVSTARQLAGYKLLQEASQDEHA